jgi:hypothetical protein
VLCPEVFEQALAEQQAAKEREGIGEGIQTGIGEGIREGIDEGIREGIASHRTVCSVRRHGYGTTEFVQKLEGAEIEVYVKVALPSAPAGKFSKAVFEVDLDKRTVRCPGGVWS